MEQHRTNLVELQRMDLKILVVQQRIRDFDPLLGEVEEPALVLESDSEKTRTRLQEMNLEERQFRIIKKSVKDGAVRTILKVLRRDQFHGSFHPLKAFRHHQEELSFCTPLRHAGEDLARELPGFEGSAYFCGTWMVLLQLLLKSLPPDPRLARNLGHIDVSKGRIRCGADGG